LAKTRLILDERSIYLGDKILVAVFALFGEKDVLSSTCSGRKKNRPLCLRFSLDVEVVLTK
jgi:hypothetical protein